MTGVQAGETTLYVTLSESKHELLGAARSHGWSLDKIAIHELLPDEDLLRPAGQYTLVHPSEIEMADTTKSVLDKIDELRPNRIVIDSMSELRMLARDPLRYRRQILVFKQSFSARDCTVLLLDDRTSMEKDLQLQSIAHGVITMENLSREYGIKRRRLQIVKLRGSSFRGGFHDYSIKKGGLVVYPRLVAAEHMGDAPRKQLCSGIKELDALWGGGIDHGTSALLMGPAGSGKSTIAGKYAIASAERGDCAVVFLFEEGIQTFVKRLESLGMNPKKQLNAGRLVLEQVNPAELSPGEFVHHVRDLVETRNAKTVVIDSLNGFLNAMPGEDYLSMHLHELLAYLNQKGVVTFLILSQHGFIGSDMDTPVDVSYLADSVLLLRYFETAGKVRQAISIVKRRSGSHERSIRELTLSGTIRVGEPLRLFRGVLSGIPESIGGKVTRKRMASDADRS